jgi:GTPase involved in cell partitioning and DNA repair
VEKELKMKKHIGIIGMPDSGKTTLAEFLGNFCLELPKKVSTTFSKNCYEDMLLTVSDSIIDGSVTDSRSRSRPGLGKYDYEQEKEILRDCEIILYLFDCNKLLESEKDSYIKKIFKELKIYKKYIEIYGIKVDMLYVLGTFYDKIKTADGEGKYDLQVAHFQETISELFNGAHGNIYWALGNSLIDKENTEQMVERILDALKEIYNLGDLK